MFTARAATAADHPALAALMIGLYAEDPSPYAMSEAKALRTLETLAREPVRGKAVVLGAMSGETAGYALITSLWSNERGGAIGVIDEIYVVPSRRGSGLASWFLTSLLERTTPWFTDAVAFELEVTPANVRARRLYERMGFRAKLNTTLRAEVQERDPAGR